MYEACIEIGVIASRKSDIWRVGSLSSKATVAPSSRAKEEDSVWFAHSKPALKRWDQKIAVDSGVVVDGMLFVQFYPERLTSQIAELEAARLKELGREVREVRETAVRIYSFDDGFSISVSGFEFR